MCSKSFNGKMCLINDLHISQWYHIPSSTTFASFLSTLDIYNISCLSKLFYIHHLFLKRTLNINCHILWQTIDPISYTRLLVPYLQTQYYFHIPLPCNWIFIAWHITGPIRSGTFCCPICYTTDHISTNTQNVECHERGNYHGNLWVLASS